MGHGIRTCLLAVPLGKELGCDSEQLRSVHQVALLRFLGCTAEASELARDVGGDERVFDAGMALSLYGSTAETIKALFSSVGIGQSPARKAFLLARTLTDSGADLLASHCEVAAMLATRLGLDQRVVTSLGHAYERWDGRGFPDGLEGEDIPLEIRVCTVARDVDLIVGSGEDPVDLLRRRSGSAYDPRVVDAFERLDVGKTEADWARLLGTEPEPFAFIEDIDSVLEVMADFVDLKSRWTRGHSRLVAALAKGAAREAALGLGESVDIYRAGLVHDLGRVGVENGVWDKPGALSLDEWEKVRLHPYLTYRILSRCEALAPMGDLASRHHERLNGSGYHRQLEAGELSKADRILAAADVLAALTSDRPHRHAVTLDEAAQLMIEMASQGQLDRDAVACVVTAAGGELERPQVENPDRLTDRELEVLSLIARELTNKQMAEELYISPKTVGRHVENIYSKIGVSTRAGAAVYAMENDLIT